MSDSPRRGKTPSAKDMYWFAHGGDLPQDKNHTQKNEDDDTATSDQSGTPSWKSLQDRKALPEETRNTTNVKESMVASLDGADSSPALSLSEREDRVPSAPHFEMAQALHDTKSPLNHMQNSVSDSDDDRRRRSAGVARLRTSEKRLLVEERKKQILEAEQEKNEAILKKNVEREATFEARRNAQRSNISFAFGSSLPRNLELEVTTVYQGSDLEKSKRRNGATSSFTPKTEEMEKCMHPTMNTSYESSPLVNHLKRSGLLEECCLGGVTSTPIPSQSDRTHVRKAANPPPNWLVGAGAVIADDKMSQSMISPSASRGRRKTDLTPTIPYDRTGPPRNPAPSSPTKRSVSMTRLDQLALPRRHYVEAHRDFSKANSTSSTSSSVQKDLQRSPSRPRSSMSAASEQSGGSSRVSSNPPVNFRPRTTARKARPVSIAGSLPEHRPSSDTKSHSGHSRSPEKKNGAATVVRRSPAANKPRTPRPKSANLEKINHVTTATKQLTPKSSPAKLPVKEKKVNLPEDIKPSEKQEVAKTTIVSDETLTCEEEAALNGVGEEKNSGKKIISEEEARAALAEKRRLAREQAEKEAELERERQEKLRLEEEERIRQEEEEQRQLEEEQLRLLEEHKQYEEEKLRKAIEEQERKEEEEKFKREEEARMKAEQEKKAKEEAERQRIELEEKLRKEEEERAERKKRLEKIMSRTRGKSGNASPISNMSTGDHSDGTESQMEAAEALSGNSSLNSNQSELSSGSVSLEIPQPRQEGSETESLNSMDMMGLSENSSLDSNLLMLPSDSASLDSYQLCDASAESEPPHEQVTSISIEEGVTELLAPKVADSMLGVTFGISGDENQSSCSSENDTLNVLQDTPEDVQRSSLIENTDKHDLENQVNIHNISVELHNNNTISDIPEEIGAASDIIPEGYPADKLAEDLQDDITQPIFETSTGEVMQSSFVNDLTGLMKSPFVEDSAGDKIQSSFIEYPPGSKIQSSLVDFNELKANESSRIETNSFIDDYNEQKNQEKSMHDVLEFSDNFQVEVGGDTDGKPVSKTPEVLSAMLNSNEFEEHLCDISSSNNESSVLEKRVEGVDNFPVNNLGDIICMDMPCEKSELIEASDFYEVAATQSKSEEATTGDNASAQIVSKDILSENSYAKNLSSPSNSAFDTFSVEFQASSEEPNHLENSSQGNVSNITMYEGAVTSIEDFEMNSVNSVPSRINLIDETCVNSSLNDSEESSLDSNLSQAMNVHMTSSTNPQNIESYDDFSGTVRNGHLVGNNSENSEQGPFILDSKSMQQYHEGTYIPKSNGYSDSVNEGYSNVNGMESEEKCIMVEGNSLASHIVDNRLNSNSVSSIDNRVGSIFDNADDINFNKISSNPFMPSEDVTKVTGNPFLHQDETKQNPITDFFA